MAVYGLGYDANGDGQFALSDGTGFDGDGLAITGLPDEDAAAIDPADWYREGWFTGLWSYGVASGGEWSALAWTPASTGPAGRVLQHNAWDSWTFAAPIALGATPANPMAAEPPGGSRSADFNADGAVDGADFLIWQRHAGTAAGGAAAGDANGDGAVDGADLELWQLGFGVQSLALGAPAAVAVVAEPSLVGAALLLLLRRRPSLTLWRKRS